MLMTLPNKDSLIPPGTYAAVASGYMLQLTDAHGCIYFTNLEAESATRACTAVVKRDVIYVQEK